MIYAVIGLLQARVRGAGLVALSAAAPSTKVTALKIFNKNVYFVGYSIILPVQVSQYKKSKFIAIKFYKVIIFDDQELREV